MGTNGADSLKDQDLPSEFSKGLGPGLVGRRGQEVTVSPEKELMNNNAIQLSQPLHEKVYERIRDSIGDLMTDEDLKILVDEAAKKAFFEPIPGSRTYDSPTQPFLVQQIERLLQERVRDAVNEWFTNNPDIITGLIDEAISKGFVKVVALHIDNKMSNAMSELRNQFSRTLNG